MGSVRDEIRQRRPFTSVAEEGVVTLLRTADLVRRALAAVVEPQRITLQQYNVLRILRGAGEGGLPTLAIAARMIEHSPGITRLLDRLETKDLVRRERCPHDRRQVLCFITDPGRRALVDLDRPIAEAGDRLLAPLGRTGTRALIRLLDTARAAKPSCDLVHPDADEALEDKRRTKEKKR
jgi:DNA-binding MarR family transcriptional regulator